MWKHRSYNCLVYRLAWSSWTLEHARCDCHTWGCDRDLGSIPMGDRAPMFTMHNSYQHLVFVSIRADLYQNQLRNPPLVPEPGKESPTCTRTGWGIPPTCTRTRWGMPHLYQNLVRNPPLVPELGGESPTCTRTGWWIPYLYQCRSLTWTNPGRWQGNDMNINKQIGHFE